MTKEAMIKVLRYKAEHIKTRIKPEFFLEVADALEQQPCEDAISRAEALKAINKMDIPEDMSVFEIKSHIGVEIGTLPSVQPQPKTGHWIDDKCSVCGKGIEDLISSSEWYRNEEPKFCPFCGTKLVDSQESKNICKSTKCENCINHNYCDFEPQKSEG